MREVPVGFLVTVLDELLRFVITVHLNKFVPRSFRYQAQVAFVPASPVEVLQLLLANHSVVERAGQRTSQKRSSRQRRRRLHQTFNSLGRSADCTDALHQD